MRKKLFQSLLVGTLCLNVFCGFPESAAAETVTESFLPAEFGMPWQDSYDCSAAGFQLVLPDSFQGWLEDHDVWMAWLEFSTDEEEQLSHGFLIWYALTEEQKTQMVFDSEEAEVSSGWQQDEETTQELTDNMMTYLEWRNSLQVIGRLDVLQEDLTEQIDEITGLTEHTEIGKSDDGAYTYYLSFNEEADTQFTDALAEAEVTITEMAALEQDTSDFDLEAIGDIGLFQTTDIEGNAVDESIFAEHELTLVNVFATWCGPCVNELPELEKIYQELGEELDIGVVGFVMDAVDVNFKQTDATQSAVETAKLLAEKTGCTFPYLIPDETALNGRLEGINAVPESFFVDRNGNFAGEAYIGARNYDDWETIIRTELENLKGSDAS
ncbi:MAG: TlpA disulfide reductase family protein [Eubacteriales bacterium]|nr:TlpA disulfide reductase family protein [Eubacteriales bacterium]